MDGHPWWQSVVISSPETSPESSPRQAPITTTPETLHSLEESPCASPAGPSRIFSFLHSN
jgi:hypothetical protein